MRCIPNVLFSLFLFTGIMPCQTPEEKLKTLLQQYKTAVDKKASMDAVLACAGALRLAPVDKDAQACATALRTPDQINAVARAGNAFLGAGELERALEVCGAALVLNPLDKDAPDCAKSARTKIVTRGQDRWKLEQTRGYVAAGDSAHAATPIGELQKSESPDVVEEALKLQQKLNDQNAAQTIAKQRASLRQAELQIADGKREAAAQTVKDVLATTNDPSVTREATQLLARSKTSWGTVFWESLRAAWIMQFLAALLMISGVWVLLHWIRDLWRWGDAHIARRWWRKSARWTFAGVSEDTNLGARDPILDALRRVPNEVRNPVWTPTRLLLYPSNTGWEVWEDFAVEKKAKEVHEPTFERFVQRENDDKLLADAFQNVQISVGAVGLTGVAKFWSGLVDWWHAGEPSFSASARLIDADDAKTKLVAVRISASGPEGMFSALAVTKSEAECDAISLSAERAAYKLLFRMSDEHATMTQKRKAQKGGSPIRSGDVLRQAADTTTQTVVAHQQVVDMQREVAEAQQQARDADKRAANAKTQPANADAAIDQKQPVEVQQQAVVAHTLAAAAHIHAADAHEHAADTHKPTAQIQDTVQQIDAHAAFRQGATALARHVRSVVDAKADRDRRDEVLREAIENLEFVQHTFNRDEDHHVYYVEALRFQAIAYALLGREEAALVVLEALEDATARPSTLKTARDRQLEVEAIYNQAILHWKRAGDPISSATTEATMASFLWDRIAEGDGELLHAERVWQLAQLANVPRANWPAVDAAKAQLVLEDSLALARDLEGRAKSASGAHRRYCLLLEQNLHRYYAIAQLRMIATFQLPRRGPFNSGAPPVSKELADLVQRSLACFDRSDTIGPASFNGLVTRAYGALLLSRFADAEQLAKQAIERDAHDQYARYIAAEAALQRKDQDAAGQYVAGVTRMEDAALIDLADVLGLSPRP